MIGLGFSAAWIAARWTLGMGKARSLVMGPLGKALLVVLPVLVLVGGLALAVHQSRDDVRAQEKAVCEADAMRTRLSEAEAENASLRLAVQQRDAELSRRSAQAETDAHLLQQLEKDLADARAKADRDAGDAVFGADDPWLRKWRERSRRPGAGAGGGPQPRALPAGR